MRPARPRRSCPVRCARAGRDARARRSAGLPEPATGDRGGRDHAARGRRRCGPGPRGGDRARSAAGRARERRDRGRPRRDRAARRRLRLRERRARHPGDAGHRLSHRLGDQAVRGDRADAAARRRAAQARRPGGEIGARGEVPRAERRAGAADLAPARLAHLGPAARRSARPRHRAQPLPVPRARAGADRARRALRVFEPRVRRARGVDRRGRGRALPRLRPPSHPRAARHDLEHVRRPHRSRRPARRRLSPDRPDRRRLVGLRGGRAQSVSAVGHAPLERERSQPVHRAPVPAAGAGRSAGAEPRVDPRDVAAGRRDRAARRRGRDRVARPALRPVHDGPGRTAACRASPRTSRSCPRRGSGRWRS